jgi:hypothetical protein
MWFLDREMRARGNATMATGTYHRPGGWSGKWWFVGALHQKRHAGKARLVGEWIQAGRISDSLTRLPMSRGLRADARRCTSGHGHLYTRGVRSNSSHRRSFFGDRLGPYRDPPCVTAPLEFLTPKALRTGRWATPSALTAASGGGPRVVRSREQPWATVTERLRRYKSPEIMWGSYAPRRRAPSRSRSSRPPACSGLLTILNATVKNNELWRKA